MELKGLVLHDRYRIYEQDGVAGMATVCLARDVMTSAVVTVLVLEPPVTRDSGSVRRFMRSAEMSVRADHPYVAPVEDCGQEQGVCYMVTRYDRQATLRDLEQKIGVLPVVQSAWISACIASALEAGVDNGIAFHGALRPENVIITASGDAQVAGFGIAPASGAPDEVLGKGAMQYAAPEQVEGRAIDIRTDLYTLGVMLYEMLAGHVSDASDVRSFLGSEDAAGTSAHMDRFLKDIPDRLRSVLSGLLAWDPDARYASPGDFIEALVLAGFSAPQRPSLEAKESDRQYGPVFDTAPIPDRRTQAVSMHGMSELYGREKSGSQLSSDESTATVDAVDRTEIPRPEEGAAWETVVPPDTAASTPVPVPAASNKRRLVVPLVVLALVAAGIVYAATTGWFSGRKPAPGGIVSPPTGQTVTPANPPAGQTVTTGNLNIRSTPPGASIVFDGKAVTAKTPATLKGVAAGSHTFLLRLPGHVDSQRTASVTAGSTTSVQVSLAAKPAAVTPESPVVTPSHVQTSLRITSTPAGASIAMDGKATGRATPATLNVTAGRHTVSLSLSGYKALSKTVDVAKGRQASVSLALIRSSAVTGLLRVTSVPAGATVKVDGRTVAGRTPLTVNVTIGSHTVQVSLKGYEAWSRTRVDVVKGIETAIVARLVVIPADKSYVSETDGFGFHYPATWTVQDNPDLTDPLAKVDARAPSGASVRVSVIPVGNATVLSFMQGLKTKLESDGWVVSGTGSKTAGGVVYQRLVAAKGNTEAEYCMLQSSGKIYQLACTAVAGQTTAGTSGFQVILGSFFAAP